MLILFCGLCWNTTLGSHKYSKSLQTCVVELVYMKSKRIKNNKVGLFLGIGKWPDILHVYGGSGLLSNPKASLSLGGRVIPLQILHLVKGFCELENYGNRVKLMRF